MKRHLAVADLHGIYPLWHKVTEYLQAGDTLYILGDCADRGPNGWDIIIEALLHPQVVYIRGNHDQMLIDTCLHPWDYEATNLWYWNGGAVTHEAILADPKAEIYVKELNRKPLYYCYENTAGQKIHLSHAGFTVTEDGKIPWGEDLIWDREHITDQKWPESKENEFIVHGHTFCASKSCFGNVPDLVLNNTNTVGRYCGGHKICIDGRSFMYGKAAILNLDTLQEDVVAIEKVPF